MRTENPKTIIESSDDHVSSAGEYGSVVNGTTAPLEALTVYVDQQSVRGLQSSRTCNV